VREEPAAPPTVVFSWWTKVRCRRVLIAAGLTGSVLVAALLVWRSMQPKEDLVWERIRGSGVWRVGMDPSFPPFETLDSDARPIGFDVDLVRAIASRWGVQVSFEGIGFDGLVPALWADRADSIVSAFPVDPRLARDVAYSIPYFEAGLFLVVAEANESITGADDLLGMRLAVEWGSEGDVQGRALARRMAGMVLLPVQDGFEALSAVLAGEADAALADAVTLRAMQAQGYRLRAVGDPVVSVPYVMVLPARAPLLLEAINQALVALEADGALADLERRWLGR
jgi:ABC-type amino acid transport substrate-binding protein